MSFIFSIIAPVFMLIFIGYLAVKVKYFPQDGVRGLTVFVHNIGAPILLFRAMLEMDFNRVFKMEYVLPYYIAALLVFAASIFIARFLFKRRPGESVSIGFAGCFGNSILIGFPIIQLAYGDTGAALMFTIVALHAPVLYSIGMITMEMSRRNAEPLSDTLVIAGKNIITQPLLIGIALGFLGNYLNFEQPDIMDDVTKTFTLAVLPCALFGIGGALVQYKLSSVWFLASVISGMKLLALPFLVWLILIIFLGLPYDTARVFILLAAMPIGVNAYIFSTYYDRGVNVASNAILISTIMAFFSLSFWLWFLSSA
ncbi:MAG: AEC family transporter [Rhizobiales bacterium]|nr:AEC family transporter [Hyphomicrobiales bacterium]NRB15134.1 AEC family transporter [Hyphomicrobiales bacterium]